MRLVAAATALPPHVLERDTGAGLVAEALGLVGEQAVRLRRIHAATGVATRRLVMDPSRYALLQGFTDANRVYREAGLRLAAEAVTKALAKAGITPDAVDALFLTSVTGLAVPSLDGALVNTLGFRDDMVRVPLFGLGCAGGAAGIARMADWLAHRPKGVALLVAVELCSLTFQKGDASGAHMVATGLFGDGAAAAVMLGSEVRPAAAPAAPALEIRAVGSKFYKGTQELMGWDIGSHGFRIILSQEVAKFAREKIAPDLVGFLAKHGVAAQGVATWVAHPGGPKILDAMVQGLGIDPDAVRESRLSLSEVGNLSSASVVDILGRTLANAEKAPPAPGSTAVIYAMGPGFAAEFALAEWVSPGGRERPAARA